MTKVDLWPDDILSPLVDAEPRAILEEQATLLGEKTSGRVKAEVRSTNGANGRLLLSLVLTAPAVPDYEYTLLTVEQPVKGYPSRLIHEEVTWVAETEAAFRHYLGSSLQSTATRKIISSLAARGT